ncbi:MAG: response regulator transcription factor [Chloroflexi bacterium]|nr:response regulator transcription factor [Chloroflexota bacterium]MBI3732290.1 response regulator transcription factor [Chloroflexota bacterium]
MTKRILLVDDHPLFRDGVGSLLRARGYDVVGEGHDGYEALELARSLQPDIILMDLNMPRMDGLAATRVITAEMPQACVVILTVSDDDENVFEAIKSGAQGYLLKNTDTQAFFELLDGVAQGDAPISRQLAGKILGEFARTMRQAKSPDSREPLSEREVAVLRLVASGLTNREVAEQMNLSPNTVKYHLKNISQKLHLHNRAQAVAYAIQSGLLRNT